MKGRKDIAKQAWEGEKTNSTLFLKNIYQDVHVCTKYYDLTKKNIKNDFMDTFCVGKKWLYTNKKNDWNISTQ